MRLRSPGLLALLLTFLAIAACGDAADTTTTTTGTTTTGVETTTSAAGETTTTGSAEEAELEALIAAAQAEGTVVWYTNTPPPAIPGIVDAFEAKYGVTVEATRMGTSDLVTLFDAEMASDNVMVDVLSTSNRPGVMVPAVEAGHLIAPPTFLPNINAWPSQWSSDGGALYLHVLGLYTIAYNTALVGDDPPADWPDLLDPRFKGEILFNDPRSTAGALGWSVAMLDRYGPEFLEGLGQQDLQIITSTVSGANSLAAGDAAILIPSSRWNNTDLIAEGAPIDDAYPPNAAGGSEGWFGLVARAPHPNAGALFMDFMLSVEGQSAMCTDICMSMIGAPGTLPLPADYTTNDLDAAAERSEEVFDLLGLEG